MALAMYDRRPEARPYLSRCWQQVKMSLDTQLTTPHTEGFMYTNTGIEPMVDFGDALVRTTGDTSIVAHPYLKTTLPYWVLYFTAPGRGGLPNFGDSDYQAKLDPMIKVSQAYLQDPRINQYLAEHYRPPDRKLVSAHSFTPIGPRRDYADLPLDRAFHMGWVAMRSAWHDPAGALFAFNSSPSTMGHSHFDANSFVVNVGGEWLATDPGYDAAGPKATEGHNSLLVDGRGQVKKGGGKVTGFFTSPAVAYAVGDASASYQADLLKTFRRHVLYVRPDYWLILDELQSNGTPRAFTALLNTSRPGTLTRSGLGLLLEKGGNRLWAEVLLPAEPVVELKGTAARIGSAAKLVKGTYLMLLAPQAHARSTPSKLPISATVKQDADRLVVTVRVGEGREDTVVLNPAGGHFCFEGHEGNGQAMVVRNGRVHWVPSKPPEVR